MKSTGTISSSKLLSSADKTFCATLEASKYAFSWTDPRCDREKKEEKRREGKRISSKFKGKLRRMICSCRGKIGQILAH